MKPNPTKADAEALAREVSIYQRVTEPLLAELHKVQAELEEARKGMSPEQLADLKDMDEMIALKEQWLADLQEAIPKLEAEAAEHRAAHDALLAEHNSIAAQINKVRELINS
jgi:hypothetical protein